MSMKQHEQIASYISYSDLYLTLKSIIQEDVYLDDCLHHEKSQEIIYMLESYDLVWIASDGRLLTTAKGEKVFGFLTVSVAFSKNTNKLIF